VAEHKMHITNAKVDGELEKSMRQRQTENKNKIPMIYT